MLKDLMVRTRSCRRFREDVPVARQTLLDLVDLAGIAPSGADRQALKYCLSDDRDTNALVFPHLSWTGNVAGWSGPAAGERPAAYILILCDHDLSPSCGCDHGFAAQAILLGATERGLGCCVIGSIRRGPLREALGLAERFEILVVIALGRPKESFVVDTAAPGGELRHWVDELGVHHVPKRALADIIVDIDITIRDQHLLQNG